MSTTGASPAQVLFIDSPRHPDLKQLLAYWAKKRGTRMAPARADIKPADIKSLLADVMIWNVDAVGGPYTIRLMGDSIVRFVGRNNTGADATTGMPQDAAATVTAVLTQVVRARTPLCRIGKAHWLPDKSYRDFEACYLPLSSGGETVDMILGGVKFDVGA